MRSGAIVTVVAAVDRDIHDVMPYVGLRGVVVASDSGHIAVGAPDDPMIEVWFAPGVREHFWHEELWKEGTT